MRKTKKVLWGSCALFLTFFLFWKLYLGDETKQESAKETLQSATVFAMDTVMELKVYGKEETLEKAKNLIDSLEKNFSVVDSESDVYQMNHREKTEPDDFTKDLLEKALQLCERTEGALDITIYPLVRAWGFTTGNYHVLDKEEISDILRRVDYRNLSWKQEGEVLLPEGVEIDFGSVAKGYTGDCIVEMLRENKVEHAILNLGGNVHTLGTKPDGTLWQVAVKDPVGNGFAGVLKVCNQAVITSGGYERYFEEAGIRYHHILDPKTGYPVENGILSVTVVGQSGTVCDGLSTALFVMGYEEAVDLWRNSDDFEMLLILPEEIVLTEGLEASFTPMGEYQSKKVTVIR